MNVYDLYIGIPCGDRTDEDWVTYIDSKGKEHIKESLNIQLDFKPVVNDTFNTELYLGRNSGSNITIPIISNHFKL
jgi:hypothetical protein